jgi:hypothetical protein
VSIAVQKNRDNFDRQQPQHQQHQPAHYGMDIQDSVVQAITKQLQGNQRSWKRLPLSLSLSVVCVLTLSFVLFFLLGYGYFLTVPVFLSRIVLNGGSGSDRND